ncbi:MAG TPA: flavodoxin [Gammaproteobacteria bacterium]|nr:flavodoxin [Gammaproteobacteria bacterium]
MNVVIVSGTVFGAAEDVAHHAAELLAQAGLNVSYQPRVSYTELLALEPDALLFITSTTGMGELPENLQPLIDTLREKAPDWQGLLGGVIGLGDACYGEDFCAGGEMVRELYAELGVVELQDMLRLDASETVTPERDAEPWLVEFASSLAI